MKRFRPLIVLAGMTLLLTACGTTAPAATPTRAPEPAQPTPPQVTQAEQTPTAQPTAPPEPTAEGLGPIPEGSPQLRASDPATVQLANGEPTLVEFFAFW